MKQNREPRQILNRQLGEDLASAFQNGIPDDMTLRELHEKLLQDEMDRKQSGKVNNVMNNLHRADIKTVKELRSKNLDRLADDRRGIGDSAKDFLKGLVDGD